MNTKLLLAAIGIGTGCLLLAADTPKQDEPKPAVQMSKTDRFDFPTNGTLRFINSVGVLTVEAWDRPDVEITIIKSTKTDVDAGGMEKARRGLDKVNVATERHGDELVVTTKFPGHRPFRLPYPLSGETSFDLEYRIKAPASTRIIAAHTLGEVNIDGLAGDIEVTLSQGEILLHLPEKGRYSIHAKSDFGNVNSDFSEPDLYSNEKRTWWLLGHRSNSSDSPGDSAATHKLKLGVGFGDIVILKIRIPKAPEPTPSAQKTEGL